MNNPVHQNELQTSFTTGGWAGLIGAICMLVAVALQMISGWFPDVVLASGDMASWYAAMIAAQPMAMTGVVLMLISLAFYMLFGLSLFTLLGRGGHLPTIGLAGYLVGVPAGFVAFALGLAGTWAMIPLYTGASAEMQPVLEALAATILRIFLVGDDVATTLIISVGNICFALALGRTGWIPRWLTWYGVAAGALWLPYLVSYLVPPLSVALVGAPLSVLWILITGIVLLRQRTKVATVATTIARTEPAGL